MLLPQTSVVGQRNDQTPPEAISTPPVTFMKEKWQHFSIRPARHAVHYCDRNHQSFGLSSRNPASCCCSCRRQEESRCVVLPILMSWNQLSNVFQIGGVKPIDKLNGIAQRHSRSTTSLSTAFRSDMMGRSLPFLGG